jgi:hypothetical protein
VPTGPLRSVRLESPYIDVLIEHPAYFGTPDFRQEQAIGVLDTGASLVVAPLRMAQRLGLHRVARRDVDTPSGSYRANIYEAVVTIPALSAVYSVQVAALIGEVEPGIETQPRVLLGKSLLQHFHFCMLGPERAYTLELP